MELFLQFISAQWILVTALIVCIILLLRHESRKGGESLSPQQLVARVNQAEAVVLDVRDAKEFDQGHIVDALNIPFAKLAERMSELEKFKSRPVVVVCKMGQHSGAAGKQLRAQGFEDVSRLSGGMVEWKAQQLPLVMKK